MLLSNLVSPLLLAGVVAASPTNIASDYNDAVLVSRSIPKNFAAHAAAAIKAFGPSPSKTMMHSNIGAAKAFQVAKSKSLQTVETTIFQAIQADKKSKKNEYKDTLAKYCIDKTTFCDVQSGDVKDWVEAWDTISSAWANYAQTETTLATNKAGPAKDSFYKRIEEPILTTHKIKITVDNKQ